MGAELFVAYYGLRFPVTEEEIEGLEEEQHPHQIKARRLGLNCHWGNYSDNDEYLVFIGKELGLIGCEFAPSKEVDDRELAETIRETKEKLAEAGYIETPKLLLYLEPDL